MTGKPSKISVCVVFICFFIMFVTFPMLYTSDNAMGIISFVDKFKTDKTVILYRSTSSWTWQYNWNDNSFVHTCPNYIRKVVAVTGKTMLYLSDNEFINFDTLFTMNSNPTHIERCVSFYDQHGDLLSYINCTYREYFFFNASGALFLEAELKNNNWIIKPQDWIDLSLYGTFLAYQSFYSDPSILTDGCNIFFNVLMTVQIMSFIFLVTLLMVYHIKQKERKREPLLSG